MHLAVLVSRYANDNSPHPSHSREALHSVLQQTEPSTLYTGTLLLRYHQQGCNQSGAPATAATTAAFCISVQYTVQ
jgi:hypothetical protein